MCVALAHLCSTSCYMARPAGRNHCLWKKEDNSKAYPRSVCAVKVSSGKASIFPGPRDRPGSRRLNKYIARNSRFQRPKHFNDRKKTVTVTTRQSTIRSTKSCTLNDPSEHNLEHKKLQKVARSTPLNDPSGARFGAQKVARSTTHPEHNLEHKKLHAQRPIRSTLWSTKSCTLNDLSGARFGAQKVARSTTHPKHALEHKKLHAQRPIRSTLWSTKNCTLNDLSRARKLTWMLCGFRCANNLHTGGFAQVQGHFGGCFFSCLFLLVELQILKSIPE